MSVGTVLGMIGGICGIASLIIQLLQTKATRDQVRVMRDQLNVIVNQESDAEEWATKYDGAATLLSRIAPGTIIIGPSKTIPAYDQIFADEELRGRIERYLGRRSWWKNEFNASRLTKEQLQNPVIQNTISDVLTKVDKFKAEHTDWARSIGLTK
jgi:hypothetical protein